MLQRQRCYETAVLLALLGLAAWLRFRALSWGEPYVYHADEHYIVHAALRLLRERTLDPDFFQYPSLWIYLAAALFAALKPWCPVDAPVDLAARSLGPWDVPPEHFPCVLAVRALSATLGTATVALVFVLWWRRLGLLAATTAAAILAVSPLHVESSHYATTDVAAMFWVVLALYASAPRRDRPPLGAWAGAFAGLAAATKYPAGVVVFVPWVASWGAPRPVRRWVVTTAAFAAAFVVASPFVVWRWQRALADLAIVRFNYSSGPWSPANVWFYGQSLWHTALGPLACLLAAVGWVWLWRCRGVSPRSWRWAAGLLPLAYVVYLATWSVRFERNLLPVVPFFLLFLAVAVSEIARRLPHPAHLVAAALLLGALVWPPFASSRALVQRLALPDTRTLAREWIEANVPAGAHLAREEYTPQVSGLQYRVTFVQVLGTRPYSWYLGTGVDYVVASSLIYERYMNTPGLGEFYRFVFERLPLVAEFAPGPYTTGPRIRIFLVPRASRLPEEEAERDTSRLARARPGCAREPAIDAAQERRAQAFQVVENPRLG